MRVTLFGLLLWISLSGKIAAQENEELKRIALSTNYSTFADTRIFNCSNENRESIIFSFDKPEFIYMQKTDTGRTLAECRAVDGQVTVLQTEHKIVVSGNPMSNPWDNSCRLAAFVVTFYTEGEIRANMSGSDRTGMPLLGEPFTCIVSY